ncbi:hypothetical protein [Rhizobium tubonense]|uniref:Uncharacterized protein n=1 Tax=Rhizobium tubonense TaxID=484088 RepID=A0A2W4D5H5_9HYPH|nr:hypothetical protein [Rhizobium tubonense]PZM17255.1 hypothetical protein CPY51_03245 [Rhizobium tubonense]
MISEFKNKLVEAIQQRADGYHAVGIMNVLQALSLPEIPGLIYSHPDASKANVGVTVSRQELREMACR